MQRNLFLSLFMLPQCSIWLTVASGSGKSNLSLFQEIVNEILRGFSKLATIVSSRFACYNDSEEHDNFWSFKKDCAGFKVHHGE